MKGEPQTRLVELKTTTQLYLQPRPLRARAGEGQLYKMPYFVSFGAHAHGGALNAPPRARATLRILPQQAANDTKYAFCTQGASARLRPSWAHTLRADATE